MQKDFRLEWRQRAALNGMLLYVGSTVYVCYLSFVRGGQLPAPAWNALLWIILLFSATNAVAKSFLQESRGRLLYYYTLVRPEAVILAKIGYNALLLLLLGLLAFGAYSLVLGNPVQDMPRFLLVVVVGALGFASALTLISGIAAKAANSNTLMPVLGFPVVIPILLQLIKAAKNALDGLDASPQPVYMLLGMNLLVVAVSYLLYPFLWRT
ncbi:ABC transporter permease [Hymenobacter gummosus]|uniref:ABC transporter permease n=1 Tax=Hymenobacter gummosus TaxID=1776032 RepID=A0A3S0J5K0_9BACT|nr:heme exporter protein CcmB [Hymenobacter gummosus]RTQ45019.1 ABC transporter permease [Hymenobacter gummosus]